MIISRHLSRNRTILVDFFSRCGDYRASDIKYWWFFAHEYVKKTVE